MTRHRILVAAGLLLCLLMTAACGGSTTVTRDQALSEVRQNPSFPLIDRIDAKLMPWATFARGASADVAAVAREDALVWIVSAAGQFRASASLPGSVGGGASAGSIHASIGPGGIDAQVGGIDARIGPEGVSAEVQGVGADVSLGGIQVEVTGVGDLRRSAVSGSPRTYPWGVVVLDARSGSMLAEYAGVSGSWPPYFDDLPSRD